MSCLVHLPWHWHPILDAHRHCKKCGVLQKLEIEDDYGGWTTGIGDWVDAGWTITPATSGWGPPWQFVHDEFDGSPDEPVDNRCGYGNSIADCLEQIKEIEEMEGSDE